MDSSSSSANLRSRAQSANVEGSIVPAVNVRCNCGVYTREATSWTARNPARRFLSCPNFRDANRNCNFFRWLDPELDILYYKRKLHVIHEALLSLEAEATSNAQLLENSKRKLAAMCCILVSFVPISLIVMVFLPLCIFMKA